MAKKAKNGIIIPADIARLMGFGGQQMRDLYFNSDGEMIAKDLGRSTVLEYMSNNGIDPNRTPMNLTRWEKRNG